MQALVEFISESPTMPSGVTDGSWIMCSCWYRETAAMGAMVNADRTYSILIFWEAEKWVTRVYAGVHGDIILPEDDGFGHLNA